MSGEHEQEDGFEPWISLSNWEQQCIDEVERAPNLEAEIQNEKDCVEQKLWILFQNAATCIAQLYKDRQQEVLWVLFQNAAHTVTSLYKECVESHKTLVDMSFQCGYRQRNKDILSWAKKRKRQIRREDLISYLTGRTPPPQRHWNGPRPRLSLETMRTPPHLAHSRFPSADTSNLLASDPEHHFETFREAVGFSANLRQHNIGSPSSGFPRAHRNRLCNQSSSSHSELNAFINEEIGKHGESRKRSTSTDVIMDSPTHKRSRLT